MMNKLKFTVRFARLIAGILIGHCLILNAYAQKIGYTSGLINVDGVDIAKVVRIKEKGNFGLVSSYELYSLSGEKLIIASVAKDFVPPQNDNTAYFYRFAFLPTNQVAIFALNILGTEKNFAKLLGESGIVVNGQIDKAKVDELIASRSRTPQVEIVYHLIYRDKTVAVIFEDGGVISQDGVVIGRMRNISAGTDLSTYEFSLPDGLMVARVSFRGGNAFDFLVTTFKDKTTGNYHIDIDKGQGRVLATSGDFNETSLKRVVKWLIRGNYL